MSRTILVCQHETCPRQGATAVLKAFQSQAPSDVVVQSTGCFGKCGSGPMVVVLPEEIWYCHPTFRTSLCKMIKVLKPSNLFWTKYK